MHERIYVSEMRKKRLLYIAVNKKKIALRIRVVELCRRALKENDTYNDCQ